MQSRALPYLLLLPATLFLAAFFVWPFIQVAIEAFTSHDGLTLAHFRTMANDWKFYPALQNTLLLALIIVPLQVTLALSMASLVTRMGAGRDVFLYIWTIPLGISDLAAGLVWLAILEKNGFLNSALQSLGFIAEPITWLGYQDKAMLFVAVVLAEIWRSTAIVMVILVAGMGLIPREYYEAAEVFGAGPWKRFVKVTLPLEAEPADRADPQDHPGLRGLRRGGGAGRHQPADPHGPDLRMAVRAAGPQRRCCPRLRDAGDLDRLHSLLFDSAAHAR